MADDSSSLTDHTCHFPGDEEVEMSYRRLLQANETFSRGGKEWRVETVELRDEEDLTVPTCPSPPTKPIRGGRTLTHFAIAVYCRISRTSPKPPYGIEPGRGRELRGAFGREPAGREVLEDIEHHLRSAGVLPVAETLDERLFAGEPFSGRRLWDRVSIQCR